MPVLNKAKKRKEKEKKNQGEEVTMNEEMDLDNAVCIFFYLDDEVSPEIVIGPTF